MAGMKGKRTYSSQVPSQAECLCYSSNGTIFKYYIPLRGLISLISCISFVPCIFFLQSHTFIALLTLAFMGSIGMTFIIIACAMHACWWPMVVVVFYALLPIPTMVARRAQMNYGNQGQPCMDLAIFLSMGLIVSSFALPIVFARVKEPVISLEACNLTLIGNIVIYLTFVGFSMLFKDEASYNSW